MVCIPCIVIPVVLWIFHRYIQPLILKFWNPWEKKGIEGKTDPAAGDQKIDPVILIVHFYTAIYDIMPLGVNRWYSKF